MTSFRPEDGTLGKYFNLTLTIIDKKASPYYQMDKGHIKLPNIPLTLNDYDLSTENNQQSCEEVKACRSPRKKRNFSFSRIQGSISPRSESKPPEGRLRATTSPWHLKVVEDHDIIKNESNFRSPPPPRNNRPWTSKQLHRSKSYPELRNVVKPLTPSALPKQTVKDRIRAYEELNTNNLNQKKSSD